MNKITLILISLAIISILLMIVTFWYEKPIILSKINNSRENEFLISKENATEFFKIKRQLSELEEKLNSNKNNYETLFEQIYTERTLCVNPLTQTAIVNSNAVDKKGCEAYCENYSCKEEPIKVCGDETWVNFKNSCYKTINKKLIWTGAQSRCQTMDSNLVVINDESVQTFIINWLKTTEAFGDEFFIGLHRKMNNTLKNTNDSWEWVNNDKLVFSNWNYGEPNNDGSVENCVELILSKKPEALGKWNDIRCEEVPRKFICEKKAISTDARNRDEVVFEFMKFREVNEENVVQFIDLLNNLTSKNATTFTASQVINVVNILVKVANLPYFPANGMTGFFGTVNNLLYAPDDVYKEIKNTSNLLLKTIDLITNKIRMQSAQQDLSQELKVQIPNIAASINDLSLDVRGRTDDLRQTFKTNDDQTATIFVRTDFINKQIRTTPSLEFNKTITEYNVNNNQTILESQNRYRLAIVYYKNKKLFQKVSDKCSPKAGVVLDDDCKMYNSEIGGTIVSVNVNTFNNSVYEKQSNVVDYEVKYSKRMKTPNDTIWCGYWVFRNSSNGGGYWSNEGCEYLNYTDAGFHKCRCNHTTHYAVLFSSPHLVTTGSKNKVEYIILTTITYIGLVLSIFGMLVVLITYTCFKALRQGIIHKALIMLAICLLLSNYLFLQLDFVKPSINKTFCIVTGVLFHYTVLASFMWMLTIAIAQYLTFVKVINNHISKFMLKASCMSFGVPLLIPITILLLDVNTYVYVNEDEGLEICWLFESASYAGFITPIIAICLINLGFFISILYSIFNRPSQFKTNRSVRRNQVGASLCCFVCMGFTWLFGLILVFNYTNRVISETIFCVLNTTQGLSIFIFHVLLSKTKRDLWSQLINKSSSRLNKQRTSVQSNHSDNTNHENLTPTSSSKIGPFQQSIKLNIENLPTTNMNSNQIILSNNNNIIVHENHFKTTLTNGNVKSLSVANLDMSTISQQPFFITPPHTSQHHHYHHHVHHHKNQLKRKRQRLNDSNDNRISRQKANKIATIYLDQSSTDDKSSTSTKTDESKNSQIKRRQFNRSY